MKIIKLNKGFKTIVDDEDYIKFKDYNWTTLHKGNTVYVRRWENVNGKNTTICLHREILNITNPNIVVDHIDGNGLNNQKSNIRICSQIQNTRNRPGNLNSTCRYKGVSLSKNRKKFISQLGFEGKVYYLGTYDTPEEAAKIFDSAARFYQKEFAFVNFEKEYYKPMSREEIVKLSKIKTLTL